MERIVEKKIDAHALPTRRQVAGSLAALGSFAVFSRTAALGRDNAGAIDLHRHFTPPFLNAPGRTPWTVAETLDDMDQAGIAKSVLSAPTQFGAKMTPDELRNRVRQVNEFGAQLVHDHPQRFGAYVTLPMPDVDATLAEIAYGMDTLKCCGVGFATSYGGAYVSDAKFTPIWEELDRRKAVAYFHPLVGACCNGLLPGIAEETPWLEIPYDTGRAIIGLLLSGTFARYRNIKWIFSHSGGPIPMFAGRLKNLSAASDLSKVAPNGLLAEFQKLYYETGNANSPPIVSALLKLVPVSQVMFGTDHPFVSGATNLADLRSAGLGSGQMNAILRDNARRLMSL